VLFGFFKPFVEAKAKKKILSQYTERHLRIRNPSAVQNAEGFLYDIN
jgi:hypothetical protein